jgi:hypothetical protein
MLSEKALNSLKALKSMGPWCGEDLQRFIGETMTSSATKTRLPCPESLQSRARRSAAYRGRPLYRRHVTLASRRSGNSLAAHCLQATQEPARSGFGGRTTARAQRKRESRPATTRCHPDGGGLGGRWDSFVTNDKNAAYSANAKKATFFAQTKTCGHESGSNGRRLREVCFWEARNRQVGPRRSRAMVGGRSHEDRRLTAEEPADRRHRGMQLGKVPQCRQRMARDHQVPPRWSRA